MVGIQSIPGPGACRVARIVRWKYAVDHRCGWGLRHRQHCDYRHYLANAVDQRILRRRTNWVRHQDREAM